jgi:S-adenosylmethionine hydrolase
MIIMLRIIFVIMLAGTSGLSCLAQSRALVFQTDFGLKDGAVSAMKGVAFSVSPSIALYDITHDIPPYNIWEAAYRLNQAAPYWPVGTVFVSVVDPGVGSSRKSIVVKTKTGHFIVTPDNGTLTLVAETMGIEEVREIDEAVNRLKNSGQSYTFHGRDVYAYTGARLAAGVITFDQVGKRLESGIVKLPYQSPKVQQDLITGNIDILDVQYGNVWTNIGQDLIRNSSINYGDKVHVLIKKDGKKVYSGELIFGKTFSDVPEGKPVTYLNSLLNFSLGVNMGSFADLFHVGSGSGWIIEVSKSR